MHLVVRSGAGPGWVPGRLMRQQPHWDEHATFMNALAAEGFVVLGGPLRGLPGGRHGAMLVVCAGSEGEARARLVADPWYRHGLLQIDGIHPWEILLGELPTEPGARSADAIP
jgi:uncharacterized protein YciI